ncbi:MAG: DNA recombination protein RmuC [Candidatus Eremiobacteraeota bacterium]|nr:DNA recombination protein RmuC [Candidatus Eremiobacteraeota bacterium]
MNDLLLPLLVLLLGAIAGAAVVWFVTRRESNVHRERAARAERAQAIAESRLSDLDAQHRQQVETVAERLKTELHESNARIAEMQRDQFLALAAERFTAAEERANAKLSELVLPVSQKLTEFDALVQAMEKSRVGAYAGMKEQIAGLAERSAKLETSTAQLASQTSVLVSALRNPTTRGKWGEVQLKRVVELAGMQEHVDYGEQRTFDTGEMMGRPDLTVLLPGDARIFVDAKAPLAAYLDAIELTEEPARREKFRMHAGAFKAHVDALAKKNYHRADGSADFVVMFVPGEAFLSAACTENPDLIEYAAAKGIYISSPLTLMALLRSYALGWQHRAQEENAKAIAEAARVLYDRVRSFAAHFVTIGSNLQKTVASYNNAVGSMESRVLPQGRKIKEMASLPDSDLPETAAIELAPREITALDAQPRRNRTRQPPLFTDEAS